MILYRLICPLVGLLANVDFLQGLPLGLVFGTLPYLLKSQEKGGGFSYTDLGLFSLAGYPYSLKLLWSPIVDSYYLRRIGRRKTWIIPTQLLIGTGFLLAGHLIDGWMLDAEKHLYTMTLFFTTLVFLCATQDIAVDGTLVVMVSLSPLINTDCLGWALTLLDPDRVHYSSTCQTVGLNAGYFISFTVFLALNSADFCNTYLRSQPLPAGLISISGFLNFWGIIFLLVTLFVLLLKKEPSYERMTRGGFLPAYATILRILSLSSVRQLAVVLLLCRIGYIAVDAIVPLKLLEKGFPRAEMALTVLIDFPFQVVFGFLAASWATGQRPLWVWHWGIYFKLLMGAMAMLVLYSYPADGQIGWGYFLLVIVTTVTSSFASSILFISMCAFFSMISDPAVGGTYLTLLNTLTNLGGMWPKLMLLASVDWLTIKSCILGDPSSIAVAANSFSCKTEETVRLCVQSGGQCRITFDGFWLVGGSTLVLGVLLTSFLVLPFVRRLEQIPPKQWQFSDLRTPPS